VKKVTNHVFKKGLNDHFLLYQAKDIIQIMELYTVSVIHGVNDTINKNQKSI